MAKNRNACKAIVLWSGLTVLAGCATMPAFRGVPEEAVSQAEIPGMTHIRTWGDGVDPWFIDSLAQSGFQERAYYRAHPNETTPPSVDILALSGGGENGAYGAGLLCGWTDNGNRPLFRLVTGISTGALIAPLAFLGPEEDDILREGYTTISAKDVMKRRPLLAILRNDGLADTDPLAKLIAEWLTPDKIERIAAEHAKGRRLLIATVNLEAQRPVIWDMGAIASYGTPEAYDLFRQIMLASASIPGAFEPQYFDVEVDGEPYTEIHVDGGTASQVFLWGTGVSVQQIARRQDVEVVERPVRLYIVRNGRFEPEYLKMQNRFVNIAGRSVGTLIKTQGIGDMYRLYATAQTNGMEFNMASIPPAFDLKAEAPFDPTYMQALFEFAYDEITEGEVWEDAPPYHEVSH